jgi:hypothetical protein
MNALIWVFVCCVGIAKALDHTHFDNNCNYPILGTTSYAGGNSQFINRMIPPGGSDADQYNPVNSLTISVTVIFEESKQKSCSLIISTDHSIVIENGTPNNVVVTENYFGVKTQNFCVINAPPGDVPSYTPIKLPGITGKCDQVFNPPGPLNDVGNAQELCCCYSQNWWLYQMSRYNPPTVECINGEFDPGYDTSAANILQNLMDSAYNVTIEDHTGDYVTPYFPDFCLNNSFQGELLPAYDISNINPTPGNIDNDEQIWVDVTASNVEEPSVISLCGSGCDTSITTASVSIAGSYSFTSGWNIGGSIGAELPDKIFSGRLKAVVSFGYSQSTTVSQSVTQSVSPRCGYRGTITGNTLIHHSLAMYTIFLNGPVADGHIPAPPPSGCNVVVVDMVAQDVPREQTFNGFKQQGGTESKPCGYPLMDGST